MMVHNLYLADQGQAVGSDQWHHRFAVAVARALMDHDESRGPWHPEHSTVMVG
jgi:hypothetical protein